MERNGHRNTTTLFGAFDIGPGRFKGYSDVQYAPLPRTGFQAEYAKQKRAGGAVIGAGAPAGMRQMRESDSLPALPTMTRNPFLNVPRRAVGRLPALERRPPSGCMVHEFDVLTSHAEHNLSWWEREVRKLAPLELNRAAQPLSPIRDPVAQFVLRKNGKMRSRMEMPPLDQR